MAMRKLSVWVGLLLIAGAGIAEASPVELSIAPVFGSTENTGSTATITLAFSEQGLDDLMEVTLANTTDPVLGSKLTAAGIELPDVLSSSITLATASSYFDQLTFDVNVSPGWIDAPGGYDLILSSDGNFQGGNPNGSPEAGQSQSVLLNLGDTGLSPAELETAFESFYADFDGNHAICRFQSVGPNGQLSDMVVPEPATLVLLALGGWAVRRRF